MADRKWVLKDENKKIGNIIALSLAILITYGIGSMKSPSFNFSWNIWDWFDKFEFGQVLFILVLVILGIIVYQEYKHKK